MGSKLRFVKKPVLWWLYKELLKSVIQFFLCLFLIFQMYQKKVFTCIHEIWTQPFQFHYDLSRPYWMKHFQVVFEVQNKGGIICILLFLLVFKIYPSEHGSPKNKKVACQVWTLNLLYLATKYCRQSYYYYFHGPRRKNTSTPSKNQVQHLNLQVQLLLCTTCLKKMSKIWNLLTCLPMISSDFLTSKIFQEFA